MPTTKRSFAKDPKFFISFLLQQLSESFYKIKIADSIFKIPKSNVQNPFNLKVAKCKTFSFSALYKFWNVLIAHYLKKVIIHKIVT